jgi:acylglycerol lipase
MNTPHPTALHAVPDGSQILYDRAGERTKHCHVHDLSNDAGREDVTRDIGQWLDKHLPVTA